MTRTYASAAPRPWVIDGNRLLRAPSAGSRSLILCGCFRQQGVLRCGNVPAAGLRGDYAAGWSSARWSSLPTGAKKGGSSSTPEGFAKRQSGPSAAEPVALVATAQADRVGGGARSPTFPQHNGYTECVR
jgi:hypothetical protein